MQQEAQTLHFCEPVTSDGSALLAAGLATSSKLAAASGSGHCEDPVLLELLLFQGGCRRIASSVLALCTSLSQGLGRDGGGDQLAPGVVAEFLLLLQRVPPSAFAC